MRMAQQTGFLPLSVKSNSFRQLPCASKSRAIIRFVCQPRIEEVYHHHSIDKIYLQRD